MKKILKNRENHINKTVYNEDDPIFGDLLPKWEMDYRLRDKINYKYDEIKKTE